MLRPGLAAAVKAPPRVFTSTAGAAVGNSRHLVFARRFRRLPPPTRSKSGASTASRPSKQYSHREPRPAQPARNVVRHGHLATTLPTIASCRIQAEGPPTPVCVLTESALLPIGHAQRETAKILKGQIRELVEKRLFGNIEHAHAGVGGQLSDSGPGPQLSFHFCVVQATPLRGVGRRPIVCRFG